MKGCLNVSLLTAVFLILCMWVPEGFSIKCHACHSTISWDDCFKGNTTKDCKKELPDSLDLVCARVVRAKLQTWDQQITEFSAFCFTKDYCDTARCEELSPEEYEITKAKRCYMDCCSEDLCNEGRLALAEETGELSSAENLHMGCLSPITLALVTSFILGNNWL